MYTNITKQLKKFAAFNDDELDLYLSKLTPKTIAAGDIILSEGQVCTWEAFIEKGLLRSFYNVDGKEKIDNFFYENQWVGDFQSFLSKTPSQTTIQAIEDATLLVISEDAILELSNEIPQWDKITKVFFEYLFLKTNQRNASLLTQDSTQRYQDFQKKHPKLIHRIPQYYIAQYIGVHPESLSRIRQKLAKKE